MTTNELVVSTSFVWLSGLTASTSTCRRGGGRIAHSIRKFDQRDVVGRNCMLTQVYAQVRSCEFTPGTLKKNLSFHNRNYRTTDEV